MCDSLCPFEITDMLQQNNNNNYLCLERGCHNRKIIVENSSRGGGGGGGDNLPQATSEAGRRGAQSQGPKTKGLRNRAASGACAKNRNKAGLTKPGRQARSQGPGEITACQTRLVSDSLVNSTISCLNASKSYSNRALKSHGGPGILADVSTLSLSRISSLGSPVTLATLEASEVNPTTKEGSLLSIKARDRYCSTGRIYIRATRSLVSQPQAVGRHEFFLNPWGRQDRNMTGEAACPGKEDGVVVRSCNGDRKAMETNTHALGRDVIIAREGLRTDSVHESCGSAVEQKKSWGFTPIDVDKQGEEEDNVKESIADSCVLGRRDTKNVCSAEDCMRSRFNSCTQNDDVQGELAGDLTKETTRKQAVSAASELHNHFFCSSEMTLENRSGHQKQGDKSGRTVGQVTTASPELAKFQIQKRNAGSEITAKAPPRVREVNEMCRRRGEAENLAEKYCCNPGGCECCQITSLRQRKLHGVCHEKADNVCVSYRAFSYDSLATDFVSALGNSQFEAFASVQQLTQGEKLGAGGSHFPEYAKACEKHQSLAPDSLTGKTECTPMPKDCTCSRNAASNPAQNKAEAQRQGLNKKPGRTEQEALLSGFQRSQAEETGRDSNIAPISDNTLPLQRWFGNPAAESRPDLSVSVSKATPVAQESSAEVGGHSLSLSTTGEVGNDRESPGIEQPGDDEEFGLFEKAGDRLHWDEGFAEFEQVPCWKKGCVDVAISPQSTSLDGWTAFSEGDTSGFGLGEGTERDRDSGGQWWLDSAVEETRTAQPTPLDPSNVFQGCFPSVTSSHWETDKVPSLKEQMQRPASNLWEGLQDVNEAIGLKYKWAGSSAQKLLLHSLHIDLTNVDTVACSQLSRASPNHRLNLFELRNPADRISKTKISYDLNKNMLA
ncbi:uncharacterized protein LOC117415903 [Acipenser ruthenus]|uniref:uncharacterized protein LOC117415903 n=1 Tax=Acipenser ruthenus TaxID=7906 RepID=UPI00155FDE49|nr:uncharacterized protein LOC117415903 [Acipenser ruthenus]